jgi:hypothetical protein
VELYLNCPVHLHGLVFKHRDSYSNVLGCVLYDWDLIPRRSKDFYLYHHVHLSFGVRLAVLTALKKFDHSHLSVVALFSDTGQIYLTCTYQ